MTYDKRKRDWDGCSWGAILGLVGGLVAIVVGSALTAAAWFLKADSYAGTTGTILLISAIPLLVLGAQSLDVEEARKKRAREARCNEESNQL